MTKKHTLEATRKKMLEFVNMARKKKYSDMDIVDVILSQFIFGYMQEKVKEGQQDALKELKKFVNDDDIWIEQYSRAGILKKIDNLLKEEKK